MFRTTATLLLLIFALGATFPAPASAYLDPGTGSLLVQFLLGAIVGSGVWFRKHVIATVARLFRIGGKSSEEASRVATALCLRASAFC